MTARWLGARIVDSNNVLLTKTDAVVLRNSENSVLTWTGPKVGSPTCPAVAFGDHIVVASNVAAANAELVHQIMFWPRHDAHLSSLRSCIVSRTTAFLVIVDSTIVAISESGLCTLIFEDDDQVLQTVEPGSAQRKQFSPDSRVCLGVYPFEAASAIALVRRCVSDKKRDEMKLGEFKLDIVKVHRGGVNVSTSTALPFDSDAEFLHVSAAEHLNHITVVTATSAVTLKFPTTVWTPPQIIIQQPLDFSHPPTQCTIFRQSVVSLSKNRISVLALPTVATSSVKPSSTHIASTLLSAQCTTCFLIHHTESVQIVGVDGRQQIHASTIPLDTDSVSIASLLRQSLRKSSLPVGHFLGLGV